MVKLDEHYIDPRLVDLYDIENPRGVDTDFYLALAKEIKAQHIIDLGCGTGILTCELATISDRQVVGVDPSSVMLSIARQKSNAEKVTWLKGDASSLAQAEADLLVMTGNVAQIFLDDSDWSATLSSIHAALKPNSYLAFESRNPASRGWEKWNPTDSYTEFESPHGLIKTWVDLVHVSDGRVRFKGHNVFVDTGEDLVAESELRFRSHEEMTTSLNDAGFTVEHVYGNWDKSPLLNTSRLMIFVARRI